MTSKDPACFYVYLLFRPDRSICYVENGEGRRSKVHARLGEKHYNQHLARLFREAREADQDLITEIIAEELTEQQAFKIEMILIASFRKSTKTKIANATSGGQGTSGLKHSHEARL